MSNFTVCDTNDVSYLDIRMAMVKGARTVEEVKETANVCGICNGCKTSLNWILETVCRCRAVPLKAVVEAVQGGADTVEKVGEKIKAGTDPACGKCKILIKNIIELGR